MASSELIWECSCGAVEYGEESPEECLKCSNLNSFTQLPEELVEEREKDLSQEILSEIKIPLEKNIKKTKKSSKTSKRTK